MDSNRHFFHTQHGVKIALKSLLNSYPTKIWQDTFETFNVKNMSRNYHVINIQKLFHIREDFVKVRPHYGWLFFFTFLMADNQPWAYWWPKDKTDMCCNYLSQWWVEFEFYLRLFTIQFSNKVLLDTYIKVKRMEEKKLRRVWLISANKIKLSESICKQSS